MMFDLHIGPEKAPESSGTQLASCPKCRRVMHSVTVVKVRSIFIIGDSSDLK